MKKRQKTEIRPGSSIITALFSPQAKRELPLSQDPYADRVIWDENNLQIPTLDPLESEEDGYDADQSSSLFLWIEKEKEKQKQSKKRKSGEERTKHSLTFLEDEDSNLTVNLDVKENIQNFSQNSQEKLIPVLTNKEVIVKGAPPQDDFVQDENTQPLTKAVKTSEKIPTFDDFDFELTEEDLKRIDQEVNEKITSTQAPPLLLTIPPTANESSFSSNAMLSNILPTNETHFIDDVIVSKEDLDLFEELERQAIFNMTQQQQLQPHSKPATNPYLSPGPSFNIKSIPLPGPVSPFYQSNSAPAPPIPFLRNMTTAATPIPLFPDVITCIRLRVKTISTDYNLRKTIITASFDDKSTQPSYANTSVIKSDIVIFLSEDWFEIDLKEQETFHIIDVCDPEVTEANNNERNTIFMKGSNPLSIEISNHQGLIITNPDISVSPTKIAESCSCLRRGVLNDKIRNFGISAPSAIMGNVRHFFIEALSQRVLEELERSSTSGSPIAHELQLQQRIKAEEINVMTKTAIAEHVEELFSIHMTDEEVMKDLHSLVSPTFYWIFLAYQKGIYTLSQAFPIHPGSSSKISYPQTFDSTLQEICGIEESIHCPALGIKGQVDMIGKGKLMIHQPRHTQQFSSELAQLLLPIELKTGKWRSSTSVAHRAQVILYLLLMNLRQQSFANLRCANSTIPNSSSSSLKASKYGILVYLNENELKIDFIWPSWNEVRSLIIARNSLARAIANSTYKPYSDINAVPILPPMLQSSSHECNYCYAASECMMYHSVFEKAEFEQKETNSLTNTNSSLYHYVMKGIQSKHLHYFRHWDRLIDLESFGQETSNLKKKRKLLVQADGTNIIKEESERPEDEPIGESENFCWWSRPAVVLEKQGKKAISLLSLLSAPTYSKVGKEKKEICLKRSMLSQNQLEKHFKWEMVSVIAEVLRKDFSTSLISVGDRVLISMERFLPSSDANFSNLNEASRVIMSINANICSGTVMHLTCDEIHLSLSLGERSMTSLLEEVKKIGGSQYMVENGWFFRVDKDESNLSISTMRSNLMELFTEPFSPKLYLDTINAAKYGSKGGNFIRSASVPSITASAGSAGLNRSNTVHSTSPSSAINNTDYVAERLHYNTFYRQKLRELIVDYRMPTFQPLPSMSSDSELYSFLFIPKSMTSQQYYYNLQFLNYALQHQQQQQLTSLPLSADYNHQFIPKNKKQTLTIEYKKDGRIILPAGLIIYPGCVPVELFREYQRLNQEQQNILLRLLSMNDYLLIRGLPGTGKTTLLSLAVRIIIARNETILMTSFTHNAINHLLDKLLAKGMRSPQILRIGNHAQDLNNTSSIQLTRTDTIQSCTLETSGFDSVAALSDKIASTRLFMTTILNASRNRLLKACKATYCVIDEAGQITQPLTIGGLLHAEKFLLVGDDCQLSPLILNKEAMKSGMNISLFQQLLKIHPTVAVETLSQQYRMNDMIMSLSNQIIYQQRMSCGGIEVSQARISLPLLDKLLWRPKVVSGAVAVQGQSIRKDWLYQTLLPSNAVIFLNTDLLLHPLTTTATSVFTSLNNDTGRTGNEGTNSPYEVQIHRVNSQSSRSQLNRGISGSTGSSAALVIQQTKTRIEGVGGRTRNVIEACLIEHILKAFDLVMTQPPGKDQAQPRYQVTILTPYRSQVQLVQQLIEEVQGEIQEQARLLFDDLTDSSQQMPVFPNTFSCDVCTIDKYQGKDADVVLLSFVLLPSLNTSPPMVGPIMKAMEVNEIPRHSIPIVYESEKKVEEKNEGMDKDDDTGNILKDWKRINVALTRAKLKLIMIGSYQMMQGNPILKQLSDYLCIKDWMLTLPDNALSLYPVQLSSQKYLPDCISSASTGQPMMTTQGSKPMNVTRLYS